MTLLAFYMLEGPPSMHQQYSKATKKYSLLRVTPPMLISVWPCNISYVHFANLTHKTESGPTKGWRLLIANHMDQSNHLGNQQVLDFGQS